MERVRREEKRETLGGGKGDNMGLKTIDLECEVHPRGRGDSGDRDGGRTGTTGDREQRRSRGDG